MKSSESYIYLFGSYEIYLRAKSFATKNTRDRKHPLYIA